jgi:hypothetical protein
MTRQTKKNRERFFAEETAKLLCKKWNLCDDKREAPDFIVMEGGRQFGLEIVDIFTGPQDETGSYMKKEESTTQKAISGLQKKYELISQTPLSVKFVGNMRPENMTLVVPEITARDFAPKPAGYSEVIDINDRELRVHVTRMTVRAEWYSVNDRAGWVDRNPAPQIAAAVEDKSKKLLQYKAAAGADMRLLLVADRIYNSGKLTLDGISSLDRKGFEAVYFFSYPESVTVFDKAGVKVFRWRL